MSSFSRERLEHLEHLIRSRSHIDPSLYDTHNVKRGLRNKNGTGVLVGITTIADVMGYTYVDGEKTPCEGDLSYRGYSILDLVHEGQKEDRFLFEEISYLLLFGALPSQEALADFTDAVAAHRALPPDYLETVIMRLPGENIMNKMMQAVLSLYTFDDAPEDTSTINVLTQSLSLIAKMPLIMAYSYAAKRHYIDDESLIIHRYCPEYSTAENILHLIRPDSQFTKEEAQILDLLLVLHAEHGGGNNSSFATHVVSSSGTDTYSAIATALGSLKGPRHGGANLMVASMLEDIREHVEHLDDEEELTDYLKAILAGEAFNGEGLIYGLGHAVYTLSDPRAVLLKEKARELAAHKGRDEDFAFVERVELLGGELLQERRRTDYPAPANVDLYSGLVFDMLGIPKELYTPLFALARTSGWCAHRLEQIMDGKIMRPAYVTLNTPKDYTPLKSR